jgi:hypothetical protein
LILTDNLARTVKHFGDDVPYRHKKRTHTVGAVVKTKFVITNRRNNPFTGIFRTGSMYGLSRLSLGARVSYGDNVFAPSIAVKFLRSNSKPSANFVATFVIEGQKGGNFFRNELSNHLSKLRDDASLVMKLTFRAFLRVSKHALQIGLSDIGSFNENGNEIVAKSLIKFPYRIFLVPNPTLTKAFQTVNNAKQLRKSMETKIP